MQLKPYFISSMLKYLKKKISLINILIQKHMIYYRLMHVYHILNWKSANRQELISQ